MGRFTPRKRGPDRSAANLPDPQIPALVRRAGVGGEEQSGTGTLDSESIVVLRGHHLGTLTIFNQRGEWIASADKTGWASPIFGYRYQYELRDTETRCTIRETTGRGFFPRSYSFEILRPEGPVLATASMKPGADCVLAREGKTIATLHQLSAEELNRERPRPGPQTRTESLLRSIGDFILSDNRDSDVFRLSDASGQQVARFISYPELGFPDSKIGFVVEFEPKANHEMRVLTLMSCVIADWRMLTVIQFGDG